MYKLKPTIVVLAGLLFSACGPVSPKDSNLRYQQINWTYSDTFTSSQKAKIKDAMNTLASRVDSGDVWACARNNYQKWYTRGVSEVSNNSDFRRWISNTERAFSNGVPRIYLSAYRENSASFGRAQVSSAVKATFRETISLVPIYDLTGTFRISLNTWNLDNAGRDRDVWAGVIFHELMHQMGHRHANGYTDNNYMTVLGDCLQENGTFFSRKTLGLTGGGRFVRPD